MQRSLMVISIAAGLATCAMANPILRAPAGDYSPTNPVNTLDGVSTTASHLRNNEWNVMISFTTDFDYFAGQANAFVALFDIPTVVGKSPGSPVYVHSLGWDITHTANSPSWLNELTFRFGDDLGVDYVMLTPSGTSAPGTENNNSGGEKVDLVGLELDFMLYNGILRFRFWDTFNDNFPNRDGFIHAGSTISLGLKIIPAPGSLALLGIGGLAAVRRRR